MQPFQFISCGEGVLNMCGNNNGLWIIIILIILFCWGGCGFGNCGCGSCGCDNGCGNSCGNNCGCGSTCC